MIRILIAALILSMSVHAWAVVHPNEKLADPALEARAVALGETLRCVVCQNESIEDSRAELAQDLRILVRQQIQDGKSDAEIRAFLYEKYGDFIFLEPPFSPRTYILWLMPLLVLVCGATMAIKNLHGRRMKR
ncbi:MAG TPA: cytochrome c-type biogenesis protein [Alphaproteobacteria bacterium]